MSEPPNRKRPHELDEPASEESAASKMARIADNDTAGTTVASSQCSSRTVSYRWLDAGSPATASENGGERVFHSKIQLTLPDQKAIEVSVRDTVRLWSEEGAEPDESGSVSVWLARWFARVEGLWEEKAVAGAPPRPVCRLRWYYTESQVESYEQGGLYAGSAWKNRRATVPDWLNEDSLLVLSDHCDDNNIGAIQSLASVEYVSPTDEIIAKPNESSLMLARCRFLLSSIMEGNDKEIQAWRVHPWREGLETSLEQIEVPDDSSMERILVDDYAIDTAVKDDDNDAKMTAASLSSDDEDDDSVTSNDQQRRAKTFTEGEGTILRTDIQVGENHQVPVGPFTGTQTVVSRNPTLVWSARKNKITDAELQTFFDKLAKAHTPYIELNGLQTSDEPYSPLRTEEEEELMRLSPGYRPLTGSVVSSASRLSKKRNGLYKECDVDAVLKILHDCNYDTKAALKVCLEDLSKISLTWTRSERRLFDDAFRHSQGSLRTIAKSVELTKSHYDVVDYWFRFKIADQFRLFQNKKREQAIRIIECIEKRRYHEFTERDNNGDDHRHKKQHWSETSIAHATGALAERRQAAKELLLDVQKTMGSDVMKDVAATVRELSKAYDESTKKELFSLLKGQPKLQKRFLDFLPKAVP